MIEIAIARIAPYAGLGALVGAACFTALGWNVRLYTGRGPGWSALLLHLSRLGAVVAAFTLCARQGAAPLLATFAGFLAVRTVLVGRHSFAPERNP